MKEDFLLPSEEVITRSGGGEIVLTTYRLRSNNLSGANARFKSILLKNIGSCDIEYVSQPILLTFAVAAFFIGLLLPQILGAISIESSVDQTTGIVIGVVAAGLLILYYFLSRYHSITVIAVDSSKLHIKLQGQSNVAAVGFVDKLERAILETSIQEQSSLSE